MMTTGETAGGHRGGRAEIRPEGRPEAWPEAWPEGRPEARPEGGAAWARAHLLSLQRQDGAWEGEVASGPLLLSQYVIAGHVAGRPLPEAAAARALLQLRLRRTPEGAFGPEPGAPPELLPTALAYVALRLLGAAAEDEAAALRWIHGRPGGVLSLPPLGRLWLAALDLYGHGGLRPIPPELFLLPSALPLDPDRLSCHARYVALAAAYLQGRRFRARPGPLTAALRRELYGAVPYEAIDFAAARDRGAPGEVAAGPAAAALLLYERHGSPVGAALRERALHRCLDRILYQQRTSRYQALSPSDGLLNCLAICAKSAHHPELPLSLQGVEAFRWEDDAEGLRVAPCRTVVLDTAYALQALCAAGAQARDPALEAAIRAGARALQLLQVTAELPHGAEERRDAVRGGFCLSDGQNRWPTSDCTAEALQALLAALDFGLPRGDRPPQERLDQAAELLLSRQNDDGGFGRYERGRGPSALRGLGLEELVGEELTDRSTAPVSAACAAALARYRRAFPERLRPRLDRALVAAAAYLRGVQGQGGAFPAGAAAPFIASTALSARALRLCGAAVTEPTLRAAARWLKERQRRDGSWGEHRAGLREGRYVESAQGQLVTTSWAVLGLLALDPGSEAVAGGLAWLRAHLAAGAAPRGPGTAEHHLQRAALPAWALAQHAALAPT